jgi:hypothetical protein
MDARAYEGNFLFSLGPNNEAGGSRTTTWALTILIVFVVSGIWHGAGWNWVVWGGLQGILMSIERMLGLSEGRPKSVAVILVRWAITFHLVCLSWVFFRAADIGQASEIIARIATMASGEEYALLQPVAILGLLLCSETLRFRKRFVSFIGRRPAMAFWLAAAAFVLFSLMFRGARSPEFIYFQF